MLYGCKKLTGVYLYPSISRIGDYAFSKCPFIDKIIIPDSVTEIGNSAFRECTYLYTVILPDSVITVGMAAFMDCTMLTEMCIRDRFNIIAYKSRYVNNLSTAYIILKIERTINTVKNLHSGDSPCRFFLSVIVINYYFNFYPAVMNCSCPYYHRHCHQPVSYTHLSSGILTPWKSS